MRVAKQRIGRRGPRAIGGLALLLGAFGCSTRSDLRRNVAQSFDAGACGATLEEVAVPSANHVPQGTPLTWRSNPPSGGDHYGVWATWGVHGKALPAGNWVHNLEHGGVALLYRCASRDACPDLAAKMEGLVKDLPPDPLCVSGIRRVVVVPYPDLPPDVPVAAAAWGITLTARCFDGAALSTFYRLYVGHAPEDTCAEGSSDLDK